MCNVNAKIIDVTLTMADHGCLTFGLVLEGDGWGQIFGGWALGHGYLGAATFEGSAAGLECLMRIMDTIGVERWEDLKGNYCRIRRSQDGLIRTIGNITKNKWFDVRSFYEEVANRNKPAETPVEDKQEDAKSDQADAKGDQA